MKPYNSSPETLHSDEVVERLVAAIGAVEVNLVRGDTRMDYHFGIENLTLIAKAALSIIQPVPASASVDEVKRLDAALEEIYDSLHARGYIWADHDIKEARAALSAMREQGVPPRSINWSDVEVAENLEPATDEELKQVRYVVMSKLLDEKRDGSLPFSKVLKRLDVAEKYSRSINLPGEDEAVDIMSNAYDDDKIWDAWDGEATTHREHRDNALRAVYRALLTHMTNKEGV